MGRYGSYYYRNRYSNRRPSFRSTKTLELSRKFGEAIPELKKAFFNLLPEEVEDLLEEYGRLHGDSAAKYALKSLPQWRSGGTNMSAQTLERLIELVPPYLTTSQRMMLVELIAKRHKLGIGFDRMHSVFIDIEKPAEGIAQLRQKLGGLKVDAPLANIPESVMEMATWLYADDVTAARAVLIDADRRLNDRIRLTAENELDRIIRTISSGQVKEATYSVTMPSGALSVRIGKKSKCFVATACYGETAWQTQVLRQWRDEELLKGPAGRAFVRWYYRRGPALARFVVRKRWSRTCAAAIVGAIARLVNRSQ